jgi:hypothetical protein
MVMDKLSIQNEMTQFDRKNRNFYDSLTDEERKKFSNYLMIRYGSSVQGSRDLQEFYLIATNERLNKHFFAINRHPKLQWLSATTVSPDMGTQRHQWIAPKKKEPGSGSIQKQIAELYPNMKQDEIELMAKINTKKDVDTYLKALGQEVKK